jgi:hypothetical protein
MRGFDYLETYKKSFNAGVKEEFVKPKVAVVAQHEEEEEEELKPSVQEEEKIPLTEKIKIMLSRMFEVEDQSIK